MSSHNRVRDPGENILLETNFDDDGILTRAYNNNNNNGYRDRDRDAGRRSLYDQDQSMDRYSESSLHGRNKKGAAGGCFLVLSIRFHF